jgi:isopenicillin N synthase-like dioxygenase
MHLDAIDISSWVSGGSAYTRGRAAAKLDEQLADSTVAVVSGHGIPASVIDGIDTAMREFFDLPLEAKRLVSPPGGNWRGYAAGRTEMLCRSIGLESPSGEFDFFEAYDVGTTFDDYPRARVDPQVFSENLWPELEGFRRRVDVYFNEVGRVCRTIMRALSSVVGHAESAFGSIADHSIDVMRLNRFEYPTDGAEGLVGMSAHEDFGLLSVIHADEVPGLQIAHDGAWRDVVPRGDELIVMVGELLAVAVRGRWQPTLHRVMTDRDERRHSVVYYHEGNAEATFASLPTLTGGDPLESAPHRLISEHIVAKDAAVHPGGTAYWDERALARLPTR